jgi:hypothetical protein
MRRKTIAQQVNTFDAIKQNELQNLCRNIMEGAQVQGDSSLLTFADFMNKVRQLRHTQRRDSRFGGLQDVKERQEKEIDDIINRFFNSQLTIFSKKVQKTKNK